MSILVLATSRFVEQQLVALRAAAPHERFDTDPLAASADEVEAIVAYQLTAGIAPRFPRLRLVASPGAGVDDLLAAGDIPAHVPVVRAVDPVQGQRMAQYVALMVLRQQRNLPRLEMQHRNGAWQRFTPGDEQSIGVMGCGSIGTPIGMALQGLGFPVVAWTRTPRTIDGIDSCSGAPGLQPFLARSNVLVCALPLTAETRGLLSADVFAALPRGAYVINVSRGGVLAESDLLAAIDSGQLGGAALDVFAAEPLPPESPLWRRPDILCTPHIAAAPRPEEIARQMLDNLHRARTGETLINAVDRRRGY